MSNVIQNQIYEDRFREILNFIHKNYKRTGWFFEYNTKNIKNLDISSGNGVFQIIIDKENTNTNFINLKILKGNKLLYNLSVSGDDCPIIEPVKPNIKYRITLNNHTQPQKDFKEDNDKIENYIVNLITKMNKKMNNVQADIFHVLVVCSDSSRNNSDYNSFKNFISTNFFNQTKKVDIKFLNGSGETSNFPTGVSYKIYNQYFDIIWFAGCNVLEWIFGMDIRNKINRAYDILKEDGIVVFTERLLYKKTMIDQYFKDEFFKNNDPTMKIEHIINLKHNYKHTDEIIQVFKKYFKEQKKEDGITYYIKNEYINSSLKELGKQVSSLQQINAGLQTLIIGKKQLNLDNLFKVEVKGTTFHYLWTNDFYNKPEYNLIMEKIFHDVFRSPPKISKIED